MKELKDVEIVLAEKSVRARVDPETFVLQKFLSAVRNAGDKFEGRLWVQTVDSRPTAKQIDDLRMNLPKVEGVRQAGFPDSKGRILISLDLKKETKIQEILEAAKKLGMQVADPKRELSPKL